MVCSEKELGISGERIGIMVLSPDARVGRLLADEIGDAILDMDVTPNQVHCMSMIGTAWEVAALTGELGAQLRG
jgi:phenylalanyl-tRNA synthetase beta chain